MKIGFLFWLLMVLSLIGWMYSVWGTWPVAGGGVVLFVLLTLLGIKCFGWPIQE